MTVHGSTRSYTMSREDLAYFARIESLMAQDALSAGDAEIGLALILSAEAASRLAEQL